MTNAIMDVDSVTLDTAPDAVIPYTGLAGRSLTTDTAPDAVTDHSDPSAPDNDGDPLTVDTAPDAVTRHSGPVVVGLDWERDGWRVSYGGAPCVKMSRDDLLNEKFDGVDLIIVEQAHMKERNPYSVAQVYSADEIARLARLGKIKLFPGMPGQLARAARAVGNVTDKVNEYGQALPDKERDAETMAKYAALHPEKVQTWKPLRPVGTDPSRRLWDARDALREDLREALNPLRSAWNAKPTAEKYALPEVARFCEILDAGFDDFTDGVKEQFGIRRAYKRPGPENIRVERMSAAITCYLAVYTREGELRTRPDGQFIGVQFILDAIGMSSSYRPNMARSQLTHHGMRHYKGGRDGGFRSEYMRNLRHFIQFLRDQSLTTDTAPDAVTKHSDDRDDPLTSDTAPDAVTHHSGRPSLFNPAVAQSDGL